MSVAGVATKTIDGFKVEQFGNAALRSLISK